MIEKHRVSTLLVPPKQNVENSYGSAEIYSLVVSVP